MVKRNCNCKYQASTPDLVKISSPKARDDPFGLVSRKSTGSTASTYSAPITPPVVINQSSGASRAVASAEYLDLVHSLFFMYNPDYSVQSTVASSGSAPIASPIIITVGQASRTAESTDSLDSIHSLMVLMKKLSRESIQSTASTSSTPISPPVVVDQASGASRVVASADSLDSIHSPFFMHIINHSGVQSPLVCTYSLILLFKKVASSAPYIVHGVAAWRYLASSYAFSEGELQFESLKQIIVYGIDNGWFVLLLGHSTLMYHLCKLPRLVSCSSRECDCAIGTLSAIVPAFCCVREVHKYQRQGEIWSRRTNHLAILIHEAPSMFMNVFSSLFQRQQWLVNCAAYALLLRQQWLFLHCPSDIHQMEKLFFVGCQVLLHGQSRDYGFTGPSIVSCFGWFGSILDLLYCSLPRPPEVPCDFG